MKNMISSFCSNKFAFLSFRDFHPILSFFDIIGLLNEKLKVYCKRFIIRFRTFQINLKIVFMFVK